MPRRALNAYHDFYIAGVKLARLHTRPRAEGYPRTHIKRIGGWRSQAELDQVAPGTPSGRRGEIPYPATTRGKSLTYELQLQADSEPDLINLADELQAAFFDVSSLGLLVSVPWPGHGTDQWGTFCRVLNYECDEEQVYGPDEESNGHWGPWKRDAVLTLRQLDGIWFWLNEADPDTPFTQLEWSGEPAVVVTNSGKAPASPTITVAGVSDGEDLHVGIDAGGPTLHELWFRDPVGAAGLAGAHDVVVDFASLPRRVTVGGIDATESYDATASDWWDEYVEGVPPGTFNIWHGPGSGTGIDVHFFSCSP